MGHAHRERACEQEGRMCYVYQSRRAKDDQQKSGSEGHGPGEVLRTSQPRWHLDLRLLTSRTVAFLLFNVFWIILWHCARDSSPKNPVCGVRVHGLNKREAEAPLALLNICSRWQEQVRPGARKAMKGESGEPVERAPESWDSVALGP